MVASRLARERSIQRAADFAGDQAEAPETGRELSAAIVAAERLRVTAEEEWMLPRLRSY